MPQSKRVTFKACGGNVKIIACIEDPSIIQRIIFRLECRPPPVQTANGHTARVPPQQSLPGFND